MATFGAVHCRRRAIQRLAKAPAHQKTDVNDRFFLAIMLALVVLLVLASWQFYSLVRS
jgi:hypothetical protein